MEFLFWLIIALVSYSYFFYTLLLAVIAMFRVRETYDTEYTPHVTMVTAALNEAETIKNKAENCLQLNYPEDKIKFIWVTDGSTDGTDDILKQYPQFKVLHQNERKGKSHAINRAMEYADTEIVVFSDANSMLNSNAVNELVKLFQIPTTGCVAGVKNIAATGNASVVSSGEGIYWRIENLVKKLESDVYSTVGAAGELFAIKTKYFEPIPIDAILDDFVLSLSIALRRKRIRFTPRAIASETASVDVPEEKKRKTRIAAGCLQTMLRMPQLLNPFKTSFLSFQYFSHKILRWTVIPLGIQLLLPLNMYLVHKYSYTNILYNITGILFGLLALFVVFGYLVNKLKSIPKWLILPYYFYFMNTSILKGYANFIIGKQTVKWERAKRA